MDTQECDHQHAPENIRCRGRPKGSKNKKSILVLDAEVSDSSEDTGSSIKRGRGRPKGSKNKPKQQGGLTKTAEGSGWIDYYKCKSQRINDEASRLRDGARCQIYELLGDCEGQEVRFYIGQTTDQRGRETQHAHAGKMKEFKQKRGGESRMVAIEERWFSEEEVASGVSKRWLDDREAFWMMYHEQHRYNPESFNSNVPTRLETAMNDYRERLDKLWERPQHELLKCEIELCEQLETVLDNYHKYANSSRGNTEP